MSNNTCPRCGSPYHELSDCYRTDLYLTKTQLAEVTRERDRLRAALVEIYATATRTLADPPCADMAALIMICTIFEALSAPPEPKPEGRR